MGKQPLTLDHLQSKKKPVIRRAWICLDSEIAEEHEEAKQRLANLRARHRITKPEEKAVLANLSTKIAEAEKEELELAAKRRAVSVAMKFKSIGRSKLDKLITNNPPTGQQLEDVTKAGKDSSQLLWNPETFAPLLIAAASFEPVMTEQEVKDMAEDDKWNSGEFGEMFSAALEANTRHLGVNIETLGNGSSGTGNSN
jgi:hypothetical protein